MSDAQVEAGDAAVAQDLEVLVHRIVSIGGAGDKAAVLRLLTHCIQAMGAEAAMFTTFIRDAGPRPAHHSLLICDPEWAVAYTAQGWCRHDPWLRYAQRHTEPLVDLEHQALSLHERLVRDAAADQGFRTTLVIPAPTPVAPCRINVLLLGATEPGRFAHPLWIHARCLARVLAMELGDWMVGQLRTELRTRARLTEDDLVLLRYAQQGLGSKRIAPELQTEAKTIDCRFHRLIHRMGATTRREAVHLAEIYGLI